MEKGGDSHNKAFLRAHPFTKDEAGFFLFFIQEIDGTEFLLYLNLFYKYVIYRT